MMLFMQHWYWYPMQNFLTLTLTPTALIGLNKDLKVPKDFKCVMNAKPSMFKYPEMIKDDKDKKKEKVTVANLSIAEKAKARKARREGKTVTGAASEAGTPTPKKKDDTEMKDGDDKKDGEKNDKEEVKVEEEPDFAELKNPSRVVKGQEKFLSYKALDTDETRYAPVLMTRYSGFVILTESSKAPAEGHKEEFYDDEERDADAPNPDLQGEFKLPAAFEFDPDV